jgi:di/tricarboxylate transporter
MLAVLGLLFTVVVAAFEIAPLDSVAILVALSSILLGTLTVKDLYASINGQVLLTVAASFGVGSAIYNTGLATKLASGVLFLVEAAGPTAILGALLGLALVLGIFVSNNTVVIMLAPLVKDICKRRDIDLKVAMLVIIYAANLSFATPFSYQTNMMVMPYGRYVFLDYVKFGVPMMLVCGLVALLTTLAYWGC